LVLRGPSRLWVTTPILQTEEYTVESIGRGDLDIRHQVPELFNLFFILRQTFGVFELSPSSTNSFVTPYCSTRPITTSQVRIPSPHTG
jgi:hypothetical protein